MAVIIHVQCANQSTSKNKYRNVIRIYIIHDLVKGITTNDVLAMTLVFDYSVNPYLVILPYKKTVYAGMIDTAKNNL